MGHETAVQAKSEVRGGEERPQKSNSECPAGFFVCLFFCVLEKGTIPNFIFFFFSCIGINFFFIYFY